MSTPVGAFVAAPVGGLLWGGGAFALRVGLQYIHAKRKGHNFDAFDGPPATQPPASTGGAGSFDEERVAPISITPRKGKFF